MSRKDRQLRTPYLLLTCEHGGCAVPHQYRDLFQGARATLQSHRGYDIGALGVALRMASQLATPIVFSTVTRLLIDLNRSLNQPDVFSEFSRDLPEEDRNDIIARYYQPYRDSVVRTVHAPMKGESHILHIGVHSCTDVLDGKTREFEISWLFDDTRPAERALCEDWRSQLHHEVGDLRFAFNEPYLGSDDGLTTTLREALPPESYLGIEIELRQGTIRTPSEQQRTGDQLAASLSRSLAARTK